MFVTAENPKMGVECVICSDSFSHPTDRVCFLIPHPLIFLEIMAAK